MKCKDCFWCHVIDEKAEQNGTKKGRCHGRAPIATPVVMPVINKFTQEMLPQIVEVTLWPTVGLDCSACGDFKPKLTPQEIRELFGRKDKTISS